MDYQPKPIDTASVNLHPDILALTEQLAENAHEVWAVARLAQGWTFGTARDDAAKKHPCLIPYGDLPESEKVHDRNTDAFLAEMTAELVDHVVARHPRRLVDDRHSMDGGWLAPGHITFRVTFLGRSVWVSWLRGSARTPARPSRPSHLSRRRV